MVSREAATMNETGTKPETDPMARAKVLADRMAKTLDREDVGDVSVALALLTGGMVHQYAETLQKAQDILTGIRRLEDQFVERAFMHESLLH
jgi:hypothetical protein